MWAFRPICNPKFSSNGFGSWAVHFLWNPGHYLFSRSWAFPISSVSVLKQSLDTASPGSLWKMYSAHTELPGSVFLPLQTHWELPYFTQDYSICITQAHRWPPVPQKHRSTEDAPVRGQWSALGLIPPKLRLLESYLDLVKQGSVFNCSAMDESLLATATSEQHFDWHSWRTSHDISSVFNDNKGPSCHRKHLPASLSGLRLYSIDTGFHLKVKPGTNQVVSAARKWRTISFFICRTRALDIVMISL